jgi:type I restriction enzyme M protein
MSIVRTAHSSRCVGPNDIVEEPEAEELAGVGSGARPHDWRMARISLAIRGIEANLGHKHADSFHEDSDLRAGFILANRPFNISKWAGELLESDVRWKYGSPPAGKGN